ncbi:MAG: ribonuclease HII [bacterium]
MPKPVVVGMDEVGRGALAGPVLVACVYFNAKTQAELPLILEVAGLKKLRDSKQLTAKQRERVYQAAFCNIQWSNGWALPSEIDELGLSAAVKLAADRALDMLKRLGGEPGLVRADAGLFHSLEDTIPTERHIKGDERFPEIGLASILAKVTRDKMMRELDETFPGYGFVRNVGYGTPEHLAALRKLGSSPEHRKLFLRKLGI